MLLTQTNWLRMPARELGSSFDASNGTQSVGTTLLKRHKILPHPREERYTDHYPSTPANKTRDLVIDTGISSISSSDASSPRTLKHASKRIGAPGLPPTPPTHSRQSSGTHHPPIPAPVFDAASLKSLNDIPRTPGTPQNQRSPPTPDVTPPRAMPLAKAFRPRTTDRYPSSRTDSFKTAREDPYSSEEDAVSTVRPAIPSTRTSTVEVPTMKTRKQKDVGLGLGLESDNEGTATPKPKIDSSQEEFVVFDGEWHSKGDDASEVEWEWDDNDRLRNVTVRKTPRKLQRLPLFTNGTTTEVLEDDIVSPTNATKVVRNLPLQERLARHRLTKEIERTPTGRSVRPATADSPLTDTRRFSNMSGRSMSNVVEAMVVSSAPQRTKTLRHTKKHIGLRDVGSQQSILSSTPNSVVSTDTQRRLHHTTTKISDRKHQSLVSNATISTSSSSGKSRREVLKSGGIPVVIIPDRRSSTKSSKAPSLRSTSSKRTKRSMSLNSAPLSQSSKMNEPGYFETAPKRGRTMSESAGSAHSVRTIDFPPVIPARRSSLSAPTSRNTSRAGSLTAESLKAHNMILAQKEEPREPVQPQSPKSPTDERDFGPQSARLSVVDHNGDPFFGKRLSTQVTPFSQISYETAGTVAEVSEAFAVSLYPHQNKSVLVVQHRVPSESPPRLKPIDTSEINQSPPQMTVNGASSAIPVTPPQPLHLNPMDAVDSPLRNPRDPPEPPSIKFIPPTPAGQDDDEDRQLGYPPLSASAYSQPSPADTPKRSQSLIRRAFSTRGRRDSEPTSQHPGFLKRTFSLSSSNRKREPAMTDESTQTARPIANPETLYPSVTDRPADDSKLHPFWRPSHFWDDLEGHDNDFYDERDGEGYDRPAPPKRNLSQRLKRTFAILPLQDDEYEIYKMDRRTMRRTSSGNMRVVKQRSNSSLRRENFTRRDRDGSRQRPATSAVGEGAFGYGFKEGNGGKGHTIPGLGVRVEYVGWQGMKRRISERRQRKGEGGRERLKGSISAPKEVRGGVDEVLRLGR